MKKNKQKQTSRLITPPKKVNLKPIAISIANRKGGVGKTTFTTNIAYELIKAGYKVVMLDLDAQMDLTDLNLKMNYSHDIYDYITGRATLKNIIKPSFSNLKIIPGSDKLDEVGANVGEIIKELITDLKKQYDFILLDHPPGFSSLSRAGYKSCDSVLAVAEAESLSIKNLNKFTKQKEIEILGIAINKVDKRRNLTEKNIDDLKKKYPKEIFSEYVSYDTAIPNSQKDFAKPVRGLKWRSKTVSQFQLICQEIIERSF